MSNYPQPAGPARGPAVPGIEPGNRVLVLSGAFTGEWGIAHHRLTDLPGSYWQVRMNGSDTPRDWRVLSEAALKKDTPQP